MRFFSISQRMSIYLVYSFLFITYMINKVKAAIVCEVTPVVEAVIGLEHSGSYDSKRYRNRMTTQRRREWRWL